MYVCVRVHACICVRVYVCMCVHKCVRVFIACISTYISLYLNVLFVLQIDDGSGMRREATVDDLVKIVEELTRIH